MMKILRKNNKKILAFLGVFLMVAFIIPTNVRNELRGNPAERAGTAFGQPLTQGQIMRAEQDLNLLRRITNPETGMNLIVSEFYDRLDPSYRFYRRLSPDFARPRQEYYRRALQAASELTPTNFALLLMEADRMGVRPSDELVKLAVDNYFPSASLDVHQSAEQAFRDWQTVLAAFQRVAESAKVTPAWAEHEVAQREQQVSMQLVEFKAEQFTRDLPEPTPEQLQAFFKEHQDRDPSADEYGIGYRLPNRLRLEWIMVPWADIRKTITADDAADYYNQHKPEFMATTMPSTRPTTMASTSRPSTQVAASQPAATQPIEYQRQWALENDVDKEIRDQLAEQRIDEVAKEILQRYTKAYSNYKSPSKDADETAQASQYVTPAFTVQVARQIQEQSKAAHGVRPSTVEDGELRGQKDLADAPPFNTVRIAGSSPLTGEAAAEYFFNFYRPFMPPETAKQAEENRFPLLDLYRATSVPLRDKDKNFYVVRVIQADPAHAAPTENSVAARLKKDYLNVQAYQKAKEAARKFIEAAKKEGLEPAVAHAEGRQVIETSLFSTDPNSLTQFARVPPPRIIKGKLPDADLPKLLEGGADLLQERVKTGQEHPMGVIEFPKTLSVAAARLDKSRPAAQTAQFNMQVMGTQEQMREAMAGQIMLVWFNGNQIISRADFKPVEKPANKKNNGPQAPQEPQQIGS
jgi:hypothetical protein